MSSQVAPPSPRTGVVAALTAERVKWLVEHINDTPTDTTHAGETREVDELIAIGEPAILPTVELMLSDNIVTRICAEHVLCGISQSSGRDTKGWKSREHEMAWRKLWTDLGDFSSNGTEEQRKASVALWKQWYEQRPVATACGPIGGRKTATVRAADLLP